MNDMHGWVHLGHPGMPNEYHLHTNSSILLERRLNSQMEIRLNIEIRVDRRLLSFKIDLFLCGAKSPFDSRVIVLAT